MNGREHSELAEQTLPGAYQVHNSAGIAVAFTDDFRAELKRRWVIDVRKEEYDRARGHMYQPIYDKHCDIDGKDGDELA